MLPKQQKSYATGETKWWESMFNNLGGILGGAAGIVSASTGNPLQTTYYNEGIPRQNNTALYIIIGVVGIAVVASIILLTRKK